MNYSTTALFRTTFRDGMACHMILTWKKMQKGSMSHCEHAEKLDGTVFSLEFVVFPQRLQIALSASWLIRQDRLDVA